MAKKKPRIGKTPEGVSYFIDNPLACPDSSLLAWGMHLLRKGKRKKKKK